MARVAVRTLLKRVRDALDTQGDEWLEDEVLLRWLNAAVPRLDSMLTREGWVIDYKVVDLEVAPDRGSEGYDLPHVASAIVGVYNVVGPDNVRRLSPTTVEDRPFTGTQRDATHFFVTNDGTGGVTTVHLRPIPTSGTFVVVYIKESAHLVLESGAAVGPTAITADSTDGTLTLDDGSLWSASSFREGQRVSISGFLDDDNNTTVEIIELEDDVLHMLGTGFSDESGAAVTVQLGISETQRNWVDYPNGWEEWLVLEVARQGAGREETVNASIEQRKREVEADVQRMAADRLFTQGPKVRDVRGVESLDWTITSDLSLYSNWTYVSGAA